MKKTIAHVTLRTDISLFMTVLMYDPTLILEFKEMHENIHNIKDWHQRHKDAFLTKFCSLIASKKNSLMTRKQTKNQTKNQNKKQRQKANKARDAYLTQLFIVLSKISDVDVQAECVSAVFEAFTISEKLLIDLIQADLDLERAHIQCFYWTLLIDATRSVDFKKTLTSMIVKCINQGDLTTEEEVYMYYLVMKLNLDLLKTEKYSPERWRELMKINSIIPDSELVLQPELVTKLYVKAMDMRIGYMSEYSNPFFLLKSLNESPTIQLDSARLKERLFTALANEFSFQDLFELMQLSKETLAEEHRTLITELLLAEITKSMPQNMDLSQLKKWLEKRCVCLESLRNFGVDMSRYVEGYRQIFTAALKREFYDQFPINMGLVFSRIVANDIPVAGKTKSDTVLGLIHDLSEYPDRRVQAIVVRGLNYIENSVKKSYKAVL